MLIVRLLAVHELQTAVKSNQTVLSLSEVGAAGGQLMGFQGLMNENEDDSI